MKFRRILLVALLIPLWFFLRSIYRDRLGAFGCFDDCFNIAGGYFLTLGKRLYTDFFFNHQPTLAYISWAIQTIYHPASIYELIYRHRMTLIYFFMVADALLVLRFGVAGFAFALLYETTKGYVFGERFLAESMIVYPLVYLLGLVIESFNGKKLMRLERITAAVAVWFVVFSREPYVPLALFLFGVYLWKAKRGRVVSIIVFVVLSVVTIFSHNPSDYWWNVVVASAKSVAAAEIQSSNIAGVGLVSIFLYPIQVFFGGTSNVPAAFDGGGAWNHFRWVEVSVSALLLIMLGMLGKSRLWLMVTVIVLALGLANIRQVTPGTLYYGAFHHTVWYALLVAAVVFLLSIVIPAKAGIRFLSQRFIQFFGWFLYAGIVAYAVFSPQSYLHEKVDRAAEFGIGYSHYSTQGEVIRRLSNPTNTMFVEEWDELIYWQAKRPSSYRYVWWSSTLSDVPKYRDAKGAMWRDTPPDFYAGLCDRSDSMKTSLPIALENEYLRLTQNGKLACLFVRKDVARTVQADQWKSVRDFSVDTPSLVD